ncbi:molybdopterin molybdotransferase MoeA [Thiohalophilus thiocyanatoxydans]|uniref:Molybdopterin molybdenumtransferase n=1 Tax=Thiohalophilus thiocyanatoxydans TaxID=381308 RepID=A0A4R8IGG6_9GAMM|nr:molybdopterin molybdotransferase MoeA [Thiohalophilus thiocyanatoxydans]TDX99287.1 molybdopterin molybdotransferase [Thiohalophilus thiocyanatoxydans]
MSAKPSCDEFDPNNLRVDQALEQIQHSITPVQETLTLPLMQAHNHILAEAIRSPLNVPPYKNSAMDGYALRGADLGDNEITLDLIGTAFAGNPFDGEVQGGQCVRIMTGAKLPDGADTVIMQEHASVDSERITFGSGHTPGQNVRHAGEDIAVEDVVLQKGQRLQAAEIGLLASLGVPEVTVARKLKVAFFSTGDELRPVGEVLEEGQIYDSNRYTLYGMLKELDVEILDLGVIRDVPEAIEAAFEQAADQADAVITSGGVSVGEADYVKTTLDKLGEVSFWKIAMKPGKPLAFGRVKNAWFFGLPGNPVSVMATFYQFALPALRQLMGETAGPPLTFQVPCSERLKKRPGRTDFQRGILQRDEQGNLTVSAAGMQASHILSGMSRANCFIILPLEADNIEPGSLVEVQPFRGLM